MPGNKPTPYGTNLLDKWNTKYAEQVKFEEALPYRWIDDPVVLDDLKQGYISLDEVRPIEGKPDNPEPKDVKDVDSEGQESPH